MKIAILGTGGVAHALGAGWKKSGHDVIFGARDASATDPDFEITGLQDALAAGDVIVNAITGAVALQAITALDTSAMAGKTLLDATNAAPGPGTWAVSGPPADRRTTPCCSSRSSRF